MADESADVETFDQPAAEGAYMDDFLDDDDDDDDDDDEPLISSTARPAPSRRRSPTTSPLAPPAKRARRPPSTSSRPPPPPPPESAPRSSDYTLRAAGPSVTAQAREYIVANFRDNIPDLDGMNVRLYRDGESTADGRRAGLQAHNKQTAFFQSYSGQRRLMRYQKQGIVSIPARSSKTWHLEIAPPHVATALEKAHQASIESKRTRADFSNSSTTPNSTLNLTPLQSGSKEDTEKIAALREQVHTFTGSFEGKSSSRHALMFLDRARRTVDVVPIGDCSAFSFRPDRRAQQDEDVNQGFARVVAGEKKVDKRLNRFQAKYEIAQAAREHALGDNTRIINDTETAHVGIRRIRKGNEKEEAGEIEFEKEFDNDDVAQVDPESEVKPEKRVIKDPDQSMRALRRLIKDEEVAPVQTKGPGSDSDEEERSPTQSPSQSRAQSPNQPAPSSPSNKVTPSPSAPLASSGTAPQRTTPVIPSPSLASPASPRSTPGNASQKLDLSHLLPPSGTKPTAQHIGAVLTALTEKVEKVKLKELMDYFKPSKSQSNTNLDKGYMTGVLKTMDVLVTKETRPSKGGGSKVIWYICWRRHPKK